MTAENLPRQMVHKTKTAKFRYGHLFPAVASVARACDMPIRAVASYGCSSGEECLTLAQLFPEAEVYGTDISPEMVKQAREKCAGNTKIHILDYEDFWKGNMAFDVLTCMSVLLEYPHDHIPLAEWEAAKQDAAAWLDAQTRYLSVATQKFPFYEFEKIAGLLDGKVADGGIFVLFNANYRLMDSKLANKYRPVLFPNGNIETIPQANKDGSPVDRQFTQVVYRKLSGKTPSAPKGWKARCRSLLSSIRRGYRTK